jgi:2-oxoglutarate ferredoxin oxidoreductase subunit beta
MPVYVDLNTLHSLHGRAIAFATGIKFFKPGLKVIVVTGDGDCSAIGGNHLIHAARRNIDLTVVCVNNNIYGMTGGQYSPTTPEGAIATTTPYGNIDPVFDLCNLVTGAGASFVARTTAFHAQETQSMVKQAIEHPGFAFVEVVSTCPVIFGRMNKKGGPAEMLMQLRDNSITMAAAAKLPPEQVQGKFVRGIQKQEVRNEYCAQYQKLTEQVQKAEGGSDAV